MRNRKLGSKPDDGQDTAVDLGTPTAKSLVPLRRHVAVAIAAGVVIAAAWGAVSFVRNNGPNIPDSPSVTADPHGPSRAVPQDVVIADLSERCEVAATPLREMATKYASALSLSKEDSAKLTRNMAKARKTCSAVEYDALIEGELGPWLLGPSNG